jgi:hypothetical protein
MQPPPPYLQHVLASSIKDALLITCTSDCNFFPLSFAPVLFKIEINNNLLIVSLVTLLAAAPTMGDNNCVKGFGEKT